jgi:protoporphyrinogen oxidase
VPRVAIIGAGFAGLAAADRLTWAGIPVEIFERSGHLGGLAMTLPIGETEIEKYYHHWFTSDSDVLDLLSELGLKDRLRWISPSMGIFCQERVWRFTSPVDLLRFGPFGMSAKLRFGLVTLFLQRCRRRELFERVTAVSWLRRYAGREVFEAVWGPLLRSKFGSHAESISMAWIWSKMQLRGNSRNRAGSRESLGYLEGGFGLIAEALASGIQQRGGRVRTTERVVRLSQRAGKPGFVVETRNGWEHFDAVISTIAPPLLAGLAPDLPDGYRQRCEALEHMAIVCSLYVLRRSLSPIYWLNVSDDEIPFGGLIEHTNFIPPSVYGGKRLVYVSHYSEPEAPVCKMDAEALARHYRPGLVKIQPEFDDTWVEQRHVFRDRWAQPIVTTDYVDRRLPLTGPWPGLYLATMSQIYPEDRGTNYAIRIGREAAGRLLTDRGLAPAVPA